jgi:hypothetical protein
MPRLDPANQRIVDLGQRLFGDNWQSALGRMCGLSAPYLSLISRNKRPVTEAVNDAIITGLRNEAKQMRERAVEFIAAANDFYR